MNEEKEKRIKVVNEIILEISSRGRNFFNYKGQVAELFLKGTKVYYKCEYVSPSGITEICLSVPEYRRLKGWYHGGTLKALCFDFRDYINTGDKTNHNHGYGGLYCPYWGYPKEDMAAIQDKAKSLGYL